MRLRSSHDHHRHRAAAHVRFGVGLWLLALAVYLCDSGVWWGLLLVAPAALHFYLGYRLQRSVQS
jgi:hypothetical protein